MSIPEIYVRTYYKSGFMDITKVCRCVMCGESFSEFEIEKTASCPKCGNAGMPCWIKDDVKIDINWHELRILTIWAERWAKEKGVSQKEKDASIYNHMSYVVMCITERLQRQHPDKTNLTLFSGTSSLRDDHDIDSDEDNDDQLLN